MSNDRRDEAGLTLVEVVISIVILSLIAGALTSAFVTAIRNTPTTSQRLLQSNDAQVIAGFLVRDAQAAGGSNPTTGSSDGTLGVSTTDDADCTNTTAGATLELSFKWNDQTGIDRVTHALTSVHHVAKYYFVPSAKQLVRTTCVGTAPPSSFAMGSSLVSVTPSCSPSACGHPDTVSLTITETNSPVSGATYTYTLTASLRPESQIPPCSTVTDPGCTTSTGNPVPFMATGGVGCTNGTSGLDVGGNPGVTVYGNVVINTVDASGCPAMFLHGNYAFQSGAVSLLNGATCPACTPGSTSTYSTPFGDPYATTLGPLAASCASGGSNPAPVGGRYTPAAGVPLVFPQLLAVGNTFFDAGTYVFCQGVTAGTITTPAPPNPGVTFYIVSGGFTQSGGASTTINGLVYAPTSIISISGNGFFKATTVMAGALVDQGTPTVLIGTPPAKNVAITGVATLPNWTVGRPYPNTTMTAKDGGGIYSWSATGLPAGLSIDSASGVISGTPTTVGNSTAHIFVVDSLGDVDSNFYPITINAAPSISGPASLPDWTINRDYRLTAIVAKDGTTPYSWSASGLPPGLSIDASKGTVSGTPTTTGTFPATITLTDASGATATKSYTITINSPPVVTGPGSLPDWTINVNYQSQQMTAANGTLPYTWAASGLPTGLTISAAGLISGRPTTAGSFQPDVTVTDAAGASATISYNVTINGPPSIGAVPPNGEVSRPYNYTLQPSGGTPPYRWAITAGALPAGLSLNTTNGVISGTPTTVGSPSVTIRITDHAGATATRTFNLTIAAAPAITGPATLPAWTINRDYPGTAIAANNGVTPYVWSASGLPSGMSMNASTGVITGTPSTTCTCSVVVTLTDAAGGTASKSYTLTINPAPSITTASLPNGEQSVAYSTTVAAGNGTTPYTWAGSGLPSGLTINAGTGTISGTPTVSGTFSVTITATDAAGAGASRIFSLTLDTGPSQDAGTLPNSTVNRPYPSTTLSATGGSAPYTWSATNLPTGLTIGATTGTVAGTPTSVGTRSVTVTVTDGHGGTSTQSYTVTINAAPSVSTSSLPSGTIGNPYNATVSATNGTTPYSWSATGLPAGLSIAAGTGVISGTPTTVGTSSVTVTVTDAAGATASRILSLTISPQPPTITFPTSSSKESIPNGNTATFTITGTLFQSGLTVSIAGSGKFQNLSWTFIDSGHISVTVTAQNGNGNKGTSSITVTNPDGGSATSANSIVNA